MAYCGSEFNDYCHRQCPEPFLATTVHLCAIGRQGKRVVLNGAKDKGTGAQF